MVTDLGRLPAPYNVFAQSTAVSDNGLVVGNSYGDFPFGNGFEELSHGFIYSGGALQDAGTLPAPYNSSVTINGVNNSGLAVGTAQTQLANNTFHYHAFSYSGGVMTDLGTVPGFTNAQATGVNASGQISAGNDNGTTSVATLYSAGSIKNLGTLPSPFNYSSIATGISDSGTVVGYSSESNGGNSHGFIYTNGHMQDLGTLPAPYNTDVEALAISKNGTVTGESSGHVFIYQGGVMTDIGTLPAPFNHNAVGQYVNDNGDVVGYSQKTGGGTDSFLYTNGVMYDMKDLILTTPGYTLSGIGDINDSGQIVASAYTPGNELDAVLLTPVPEPASFVPVLLTGALLRRWGRDRDRGIKRGRCD